MKVIHKNDLSAYLSDWKMKMEMMNKLSKIGKNKPQPILKTFQAISTQNIDLRIVLRYLDLKLKILENNKLPFSKKYQDYADAIVFLKVTYTVIGTVIKVTYTVIGTVIGTDTHFLK